MNISRATLLTLTVITCLSIFPGCSKSDSKPLSEDKIPSAMSEAFKQSTGDTKAMASDCAAACQAQDTATAFKDLHKLSQSSDLTAEQRAVTARAMAATFQKLRAASENGDPAAQALIHEYISTR